MIWLFPLYLLGAGAVIVPILMHLRRRPPQQSVEFSSLMFLDAQTPVPVSKRKLEHWLLLLLRCLALLLLALMFARPLWHNATLGAKTQGDAIAILVDRSASMRRGDLWKQALAQAEKVIQKAKPEDRLAIATFDGTVQTLWSFDQDASSVTSRAGIASQQLAKAQPGWGKTDIGKALQETVAAFTSTSAMSGRRNHIVLITDLQEGAHLEALRSMVWPEGIRVSVQRVTAPNLNNFSLAPAASAPETALPNAPALATPPIRVRLANMRDSKVSDFRLAWDKGGEVLTGYLPPGASRVLAAPPAPDNAAERTLTLTGDAWDFDNRIFVSPIQPQPVRIAFIGEEATRNEPASPLFYLSRALQITATLAPELVVIPPSAKTLPLETRIAFIGGPSLSEALVQSLRDFMKQGGMCVQILDSAAAQAAARSLVGANDINLTEGATPAGGYLMLAEVDGTHPLLRPFTDARLRDFTKLRFWKHRHVELGPQASKELQVIARFENGESAILTRALGKGSLVLLASGWQPADSQLALSTKFVPLLYGWLEAAGFRNDDAPSFSVGDSLPAESGTTVVVDPDQETLIVKADKPLIAEKIGFYTITPAKGKAQIYAVNLPPEEGRITPGDADQLRDLGIRLESSPEASSFTGSDTDEEHLAVSDEEKRQRGWLWILAGILVVLASETWLANRLRASTEAPPVSE